MQSSRVSTGVLFLFVTLISTFGVTSAAEAQQAPAVSGAELFNSNCAVCHGRGGKGDGPMGQVLTIRPADLTIIAKNSGGMFPTAKIYELVDGRNPAVRGHGGPDMPVWGEVFSINSTAASVKDRIGALVKYIESIQVK
jgi:mono/diheme cytochrome c family protein